MVFSPPGLHFHLALNGDNEKERNRAAYDNCASTYVYTSAAHAASMISTQGRRAICTILLVISLPRAYLPTKLKTSAVIRLEELEVTGIWLH